MAEAGSGRPACWDGARHWPHLGTGVLAQKQMHESSGPGGGGWPELGSCSGGQLLAAPHPHCQALPEPTGAPAQMLVEGDSLTTKTGRSEAEPGPPYSPPLLPATCRHDSSAGMQDRTRDQGGKGMAAGRHRSIRGVTSREDGLPGVAGDFCTVTGHVARQKERHYSSTGTCSLAS